MARTAIKGIITIAIVIVIAIVGMVGWNYFTTGNAVGTATTVITGNSNLGEIVGKVSAGQDLTDEEIKKNLALSDDQFNTFKAAASAAGVDINSSAQLQQIAAKNAGNIGQIQDVISDLQLGGITGTEAAAKLKDILILEQAN